MHLGIPVYLFFELLLQWELYFFDLNTTYPVIFLTSCSVLTTNCKCWLERTLMVCTGFPWLLIDSATFKSTNPPATLANTISEGMLFLAIADNFSMGTPLGTANFPTAMVGLGNTVSVRLGNFKLALESF